MRERRFIGTYTINNTTLTIRDRNIVHQIGHVVRLKPHDEIVISDGEKEEYFCSIVSITKTTVVCDIKKRNFVSEPKKKIALYCAILKKDNFELVAQKVTEIGITDIIPLITDRTIKTKLSEERLKKIIREATEQSGQTRLPVLHAPTSFMNVIRDAQEVKIVFHQDAPRLNSKEMPKDAVNIFIGPEGGWSDEELALAEKSGALIRSLGEHTLRAETAAIVASYLAYSAEF